MFIDINKIGREGLRFDLALAMEGLTGPSGEPIPVTTATLEGQADRGPDGVDLRGRLRASVTLACSRCLEAFPVPVDVDFALILVGDGTEYGRNETEIAEKDASLFYAEQGIVQLADVAREQIYLSLPLKPVCQSDCEGLCPECGANRNTTECGCRAGDTDPRLAPLLAFKNRRPRS